VLRAGDTALGTQPALDQRVPPGHVRRGPHAHSALAGFHIILIFIDGMRKEYSGELTKYVIESTPAFSALCQLIMYHSVIRFVSLLLMLCHRRLD
jgi:hypothetical protein